MSDLLRGLSGTEKRELLARLLKEKAASELQRRPEEFPMSAGQQGLWYAYRRDPDVTAYNVALPSRIRSTIDLNAMRRAIEHLVHRHSALRTVFGESDSTHEPVQRVQGSLTPEFRVIDTPDADDTELAELVSQEIGRAFDLTRGPMLRLAAFRVAEDDVVIVATTHHIVVDFWSLVLIMDEIRELYPAFARGSEPQLPAAPSNYDRFVRFQNELVAGPRGKEIAAYWKSQLADVPPLLQWPTDFYRPEKFTHRASVVPLKFPTKFGARITALARRLGVTGNVVVMALLQVLIGRFAGQDSFSIGTPFSGRSQREFEKTVGFFVNLLPISADLSMNPTLEELIRSVGHKMVDALANETLPFSEIVRHSGIGRDPRHHPLFQVSCTFEKSHLASEQGRGGFVIGDGQAFADFAGMRQESFHVDVATCHYDVEFVFEFDGDELRGMICYCRDLFADETIRSMADQFIVLSSRLLEHPSRPVKSIRWCESKRTSTIDPTATRQTLCQLLSDSDHEIVQTAKRFASCLRRCGVRPQTFVPVCMPRGRDAWVGILGVMYCGATPIPIDADQPAVSPEVLQQDAEIRFIVADRDEAWANAFEATIVSTDQIRSDDAATTYVGSPEDLAYVIYTSGSTGRPKGVMVRHDAIANTIARQRSATPFTNADRFLVLLSHQFDASMAVVVTTLLQNATPIWPDDIHQLDLDKLIDQILRDRITIVGGVTSFIRALVDHPRFAQCTCIRQIWAGAESMPTELPALIRSKLDCEIWNYYGPTEAAVQVTAYRIEKVDPRRRIPIGYEIDGVQVDLVDEELAPVPIGVPGQIVISGRGLADGYLNRPELTERTFVTSEHISDTGGKPARIYLTGDLGRRRGDGAIEFLGRIDHQVKVRGYRVELEEIELVIERFHGIRHAAVKVDQPGIAGERLVAFVSGIDESQLDALNRHLSSSLPSYKRPSLISFLDEIPLGSNGKIDRKRLPDLAGRADSDYVIEQPRCELERFLSLRFADALGLESFGIDTNFFEAGGTSLQAAILTSELSTALGVSIPTSLLFDLGDVRSVARRLAELYEDHLRDRFGDESIKIAQTASSNFDMDPLLVELRKSGDRHPVFMVHPPGGIVACYRELATQLSQHQPLVAIRSRGLHGDELLPESLAEMARDYVDSIRSYQSSGPYWIGGWSLGGVIAFEVARQLVDQGQEVSGLILLDSTVSERSDPDAESAGLEYGLEMTLAQLSELSADDQLPFLYQHAERLGVLEQDAPQEVVEKAIADLQRLFAHHVGLCQDYEMCPLDVPVLLIRPSDIPGKSDARPDRGWGRWTGAVTVRTASGHHHSMVKSPGAGQIAQQIEAFVGGRE